jgi:hypothetical protein
VPTALAETSTNVCTKTVTFAQVTVIAAGAVTLTVPRTARAGCGVAGGFAAAGAVDGVVRDAGVGAAAAGADAGAPTAPPGNNVHTASAVMRAAGIRNEAGMTILRTSVFSGYIRERPKPCSNGRRGENMFDRGYPCRRV